MAVAREACSPVADHREVVFLVADFLAVSPVAEQAAITTAAVELADAATDSSCEHSRQRKWVPNDKLCHCMPASGTQCFSDVIA